MRRAARTVIAVVCAAHGIGLGQISTPCGGPNGQFPHECPPILPIDLYFDGTVLVDNAAARLDGLPADLTPAFLPPTAPGAFPTPIVLTALGDNSTAIDSLIVYLRPNGFFAVGLILNRGDTYFAFRFDGGDPFSQTRATVRIDNRVQGGPAGFPDESGSEFILIGDTGEIGDPRPLTDSREVFRGGTVSGTHGGSIYGLDSVDEGGVIPLTYPDRALDRHNGNTVGGIVNYFLAVDTQFSEIFPPQPIDLDIVIQRVFDPDVVPVNVDAGALSAPIPVLGTTRDDPTSPGTLAAPQARRDNLAEAYRLPGGTVTGPWPGAEHTIRFGLPIASRVSVIDNDPILLPFPRDRAFAVSRSLDRTRDVLIRPDDPETSEDETILGTVLDAVALSSSPGVLTELPPGEYYLTIDGDTGSLPGLGLPFDLTLGIEPIGCTTADLAAPFGVLSQADVADFVARFFADDAVVASLAEPSDVVSQADVDAFVQLFFQGCMSR